ncbi:MAG: class I SAM-dependent DNA methyltransferase, partial [Infirmifilum sp.]
LNEKIRKAKNNNEKEKVLKVLEEQFYIVDNIGAYTFAPYKVVWKYIAGAITGKATSFECAVLEPINGKPAIPHEKLMLISFNNSTEAHYVAGVLNSNVARAIVASYVIETEISTHIADIIKIPKFQPDNPLHQKIAELSIKAHKLAKCIHARVKPEYCREVRDPGGELRRVEEELDKAVAELYGIPEDAVREFRRLLGVLSGEEAPGEEVEAVSVAKPSLDFTKTDVVAGERDYVEFNVSTAGQCDKAEVVLEGPWGVKSLSVGDGRQRFEVVLPEGIYEIKYSFKCSDYVLEGSVRIASSKSVPTGPRREKTLKLGLGEA